MKKDQIILLEDRGLISINGEDVKSFLQNPKEGAANH